MIIKGDVVKEITKLKKQDGPGIQVHGSGDLIQTLLKHDLIDELRVRILMFLHMSVTSMYQGRPTGDRAPKRRD